jgi:hypothetical protein
MAASIILYNLKKGVSDAAYRKWCEEYKGPLFLSLNGCESFTLLKMFGGIKGNGKEGRPPEETPAPFNYVGIVEVTSLEEWKQSTESNHFKEDFFSQWFSEWVADFYVLVGDAVYRGQRGEK